jgi:hypothetical protein
MIKALGLTVFAAIFSLMVGATGYALFLVIKIVIGGIINADYM